MTVPALTAVTHRWESDLAGHLGRSAHVHVARRCADLAELLGCAAAGVGQVAAVSVDLRGMDAAVVHRLTGDGVRVLGVHPPGDEVGRRVLLRWGVGATISADADADTIEGALADLLTAAAHASPDNHDLLFPGAPGTSAGDLDEHGTPDTATGAGGLEAPDEVHGSGEGRLGRTVVVWGPVGSPGRTTVAVHLAAALSDPLAPVVLVDADTYGASVAQALAVLDEAPGLAAAARAADQGVLDRDALARLAPLVQPGLRVLTGLPRADRWPEVREHAVADVLAECARLATWTVVDIGFCLERDEELSFDTAAPRRNGAALAALAAADLVVVVGTADPVGLQRLVRAVDELREHTTVPSVVVVNRVRAGAVGRDPDRRVREVLQRFAGLEHVHLVPEDRESLDVVALTGRTLGEVRSGSPAHRALVDLAHDIRGDPATTRRARSGSAGRLRARWRSR